MKKTIEKKYVMLLSVIALGAIAIWYFVGEKMGLNTKMTIDDMASIQFSLGGDNIVDKLKSIVENDPTNVPIYYLMLSLWIKMFGYKTCAMRMLSQIFGAACIVMIGLIANKINGKRAGIIASILVAPSLPLVYGSYQIRAYSLLILGATILFYIWLFWDGTKLSGIKIAFAMLLISYIHFFGVLVCAAICSLDIFRIILKKENIRKMYIYVGYALGFIPYLIVSYINAMNRWGTFWPPVPCVRDIFSMVQQLCPLGNVTIYFFWCVFFVYLLWIIKMIREGKRDERFNYEVFSCFWIIFAILFVVFIYSRYINPTSSLWVYRYFLALLPFVVVIISYGIDEMLKWIERKCELSVFVFKGIIFCALMMYICSGIFELEDSSNEILPGGNNFEEVAEILRNQNDIYDDTTLVYFAYPFEYTDSWIKYFTQNGKYQMPNTCFSEEELLGIDLNMYENVYTVELVYNKSETVDMMLSNSHLLDEELNNVFNLKKYVK